MIATASEVVETLLCFDGMLGVLASPDPAPGIVGPEADVGLVIVVGGPQTRIGSHRQFVSLARAAARAGHPCLRFDYTGMGDSAGPMPDFEQAGPDIGRACDALQRAVPHCRRIVLWGLCEGATAALFHALRDERIVGVVAANPWVRSEATRSAAIVSQHYASRLRSREFWIKLATGKVDVIGSLREALCHARRAVVSRRSTPADPAGADGPAGPTKQAGADLVARVAHALSAARCPVRLQLSGNDLTAAEFEHGMERAGLRQPPKVTWLRLARADHTWSDPDDWCAVVHDTLAVLAAPEADGNRAINEEGPVPRAGARTA